MAPVERWVHAPGSVAVLSPSRRQDELVTVRVVAVHLEAGNHVSYTVAWLSGGTRNEQTVDEDELTCDAVPTGVKVGFKE